jgi:hypothetical protein
MTASDRIVKALGIAKACYPQWKPVEGTEQAWALLLQDVSDEAFFQALLAHCQSSKWPPSIAEIRELCGIDKLEDELLDNIGQVARDRAGPKPNPLTATSGQRQHWERRHDKAFDGLAAEHRRTRAMGRCEPLVKILGPALGIYARAAEIAEKA